MNQLIREGSLPDWRYFESPRRFGPEYGTQKGWERFREATLEQLPNVNEEVSTKDGFQTVLPGMEIPFEK